MKSKGISKIKIHNLNRTLRSIHVGTYYGSNEGEDAVEDAVVISAIAGWCIGHRAEHFYLCKIKRNNFEVENAKLIS